MKRLSVLTALAGLMYAMSAQAVETVRIGSSSSPDRDSSYGGGSLSATIVSSSPGRHPNVFHGPSTFPRSVAGGHRQDVLAIVPKTSTYIAGGLALLPLLFGLRARWRKR